MTELLITLMNAPRAVQRSVALAILSLSVICGVSVVYFLGSILTAQQDRIEDLRVELYHLERLIARKPSDDQSVALSEGYRQLFIEGESLSLIQAKLQQRVNDTAGATGANVVSISGTNQIEVDEATFVGVRADIEGSLQAFHELLRVLETSEPPLVIREASLHATTPVIQDRLSAPLQLAGQITLYGAVNPAIALTAGKR